MSNGSSELKSQAPILLNPNDKALKAGLDLICEFSFSGIGGHFSILLIWNFIVFELLPIELNILLFVPQAIVLIGRTLLVSLYKKQRDLIHTNKELKYWVVLFAIGASLTGMIWGASYFIISDLTMEYHFLFFALLISVTAAGVTTLGSVFPVFIAYTISTLGVGAIWLGLHGGMLYNIAAFWFFYFIVFAYSTARRYSSSLNNAVIEKEIANEKSEELLLLTEELQVNAERFSRWKESNFIGILHLNISGEIVSANKTILNMLGYSSQDVEAKSINAINLTPIEFARIDNNAYEEATAQGYWTPYEKEFFHKDGRRIPVLIGGSIFHKDNHEFIVFVVDLTERKQQEEQIRRSQKMDALGKLTGGIAHDYNNMLGVVLGYSELLKNALKDQPKLANYAQQIHHAGSRGANLTKKILSFTSNKSGKEEIVNVNSLLVEQQHMMEKTLTVRIQLTFDLADNLWPILVDMNDLEDVILNISINAMQAMEKTESGAKLTIRTRNQAVTTQDAHELGLIPGKYVQLTFADTGCGIDKNIQDKIFDPFFSTKDNKGTGLGLAQVFGFIKRSGGTIKVYSELNEGSQFELYFPQHSESNLISDEQYPEITDNNSLRGKENILIVDDEKALLDLASELIAQMGYQVFLANNADQAIQILEAENIDLMMSDIIMPGTDGYQLAAIVNDKYPDVKVQLVSGFSGEQQAVNKNEKLQYNLIHKPYHAETLFKHIRNLLDNVD